MTSPSPNKTDTQSCFFKVPASSGQLGIGVIVVCHAFDFSVILCAGDLPSSSIIVPERCCGNGHPHKLVFAVMVVDACPYRMLYQADKTSASIRDGRTHGFWMALMRHSHSESNSYR